MKFAELAITAMHNVIYVSLLIWHNHYDKKPPLTLN
jgi:hypothetical protein